MSANVEIATKSKGVSKRWFDNVSERTGEGNTGSESGVTRWLEVHFQNTQPTDDINAKNPVGHMTAVPNIYATFLDSQIYFDL